MDEQKLRRLLWLRHGCPVSALYGDDGEMHCNRCLIDFKRGAPDDIEARWRRLNQEKWDAEAKQSGYKSFYDYMAALIEKKPEGR